MANDVKIQSVERLHSKIFLNEQKIIVTSMNLLRSSSEASLEVAIVITNPSEQEILRDYVSKSLGSIASPIPNNFTWTIPSGTSVALGHCIRCGRNLLLDHYHPLCDGCYAEWAA